MLTPLSQTLSPEKELSPEGPASRSWAPLVPAPPTKPRGATNPLASGPGPQEKGQPSPGQWEGLGVPRTPRLWAVLPGPVRTQAHCCAPRPSPPDRWDGAAGQGRARLSVPTQAAFIPPVNGFCVQGAGARPGPNPPEASGAKLDPWGRRAAGGGRAAPWPQRDVVPASPGLAAAPGTLKDTGLSLAAPGGRPGRPSAGRGRAAAGHRPHALCQPASQAAAATGLWTMAGHAGVCPLS